MSKDIFTVLIKNNNSQKMTVAQLFRGEEHNSVKNNVETSDNGITTILIDANYPIILPPTITYVLELKKKT